MGSLHLLLHTHWDLEPFVPEDAPRVFAAAFRFPLSAFPPRGLATSGSR